VKVPAVKPYFWVVKLLTTAMGEAVSDYLVNDVNKYLAVVVGFILFAIAIRWQFRTPVYRTWPYWSAVAMVAVFGTMCADVMHIVLGLPYLVSATFYAICLAVTFAAWHRTEGTLDRTSGTIHGNLYLSGGDPSFHYEQAVMIARRLNDLGIRTITGDLVIAPGFTMNFNSSARRSGEELYETLDSKLRSSEATGAWTYERTALSDQTSLHTVPSMVVMGGVQVNSEGDQAAAEPGELVPGHRGEGAGGAAGDVGRAARRADGGVPAGRGGGAYLDLVPGGQCRRQGHN